MTASLLSAFSAAVHSRFAGARALVQYQRDPLGFIVDKLKVPERTLRWSVNPGYEGHVWDGTPDPLIAMMDGLVAGLDVAVEAGTGTQKSHTTACLVLWFMAAWDGARVFTFAPKEDQLRLYIWTEITKLWPRFSALFPLAELTDLRVRMLPGSDEWGAWGYSVGVRADEEVATKAAGMHAAHMLIVNEETPGQHPAVLAAQKNTMTADHNIRISLGNPDHQMDALHTLAYDERGQVRPGVRAIRISALDHPNVVTGQEIVPGAVGRKSIAARRADYGEGSRLYESRVRGISPAEAEEALIKLEWVRRAQARYGDPLYRIGPRALGVDVANSANGDEAAIAFGVGRTLEEIRAFPCPNASDLGLTVALRMDADEIDPQRVGVDEVGVGAATMNKLREKGQYVRGLNGGARPEITNSEAEFNNLRSQMLWQLREDLRLDEIALPPDEELAQDLITPQWKTQNGKIVVEAKEDIKKRLPARRSPNKGDAAVYWNWVRSRAPVVQDVPRGGKTENELAWAEVHAHAAHATTDAHRYGTVLEEDF